jgi:ribosomal protein S18 acetylase RimI-like enzyme
VGSELLPELSHRNLIAHCRYSPSWGVGGQAVERDGVLLFAGSSPAIGYNGAFRLQPDVSPETVIEQSDEFFGALGRGYIIRARDTGEDDDVRAACDKRGLLLSDRRVPQMARTTRFPHVPLPPNTEVRLAATIEDIAEFVRVCGSAYTSSGLSPQVVAMLFSLPDRLLDCLNAVQVVTYLDGRAVAAAQTWLSHGVAGIYWVGTAQEVRGLGFGEAVSRAAMNFGFDKGAQAATLQGSRMGEPLFRHMRFRELYGYDTYVCLRAGKRPVPPSGTHE